MRDRPEVLGREGCQSSIRRGASAGPWCAVVLQALRHPVEMKTPIAAKTQVLSGNAALCQTPHAPAKAGHDFGQPWQFERPGAPGTTHRGFSGSTCCEQNGQILRHGGRWFGVRPSGCTGQCRLKPELHACLNRVWGLEFSLQAALSGQAKASTPNRGVWSSAFRLHWSVQAKA